MKNSIRLASAILAAVLCVAAFSACANDIKQPLTDVTAITTEPPLTTEKLVTDTTDIPTTTQPSASELTPEEIQAEKIKELLYLTNDGYIKIKGADSIKLPRNGFYIYYDNSPETKYFLSTDLITTELLASVPSYAGTNSPHSYTLENGKLTVTYNNGENILILDGEFIATDYKENEAHTLNFSSLTVSDTYISTEISTFLCQATGSIRSVLFVIYNEGAKIDYIFCERDFDTFALSENGIGFATCGPVGRGGNTHISVYKTENGGKTFSLISDSLGDAGSLPCGTMALSYANSTIYACGSVELNDTLIARLGVDVVDSRMHTYSDFYKGLYDNGRYVELTPYFENEIGVKAVLVQVGDYYIDTPEEPIAEGYMYFLSLDGGDTWTLFDPTQFLDNVSSTQIKYSAEKQPK